MRRVPAPEPRQLLLMAITWSAAGALLASAPQGQTIFGVALAFTAGLSALWSP
jgi:hypothetical protein